MDHSGAYGLRPLLRDVVTRIDAAPLPHLLGVTAVLALLALGMLALRAAVAAQP